MGEFGYASQFPRVLRRFALFAIAFSVVSITTGIFVNYPELAAAHDHVEFYWFPHTDLAATGGRVGDDGTRRAPAPGTAAYADGGPAGRVVPGVRRVRRAARPARPRGPVHQRPPRPDPGAARRKG